MLYIRERLLRHLLLAFVSSAIVAYGVCVLRGYNEPAKYPTVGSDDKVTTSSTKATVPCDKECRRFQRLMAQWPPTKPKAAIVYLASRLQFLVHSIATVNKFFCREFDYPVVIFHEAWVFEIYDEKQNDNQRAARDAVLKAAAWNSSLIFFQQVEFKMPTFLPKPVPGDIPCHSKIGYRHMCRFQAKGRV